VVALREGTSKIICLKVLLKRSRGGAIANFYREWPGNEKARERVGQGANRPESYWPIRCGERIGPGAKRLGTASTYAVRAMQPNTERQTTSFKQ